MKIMKIMKTLSIKLLTAASIIIVAPAFAGDQSPQTTSDMEIRQSTKPSAMEQNPTLKMPKNGVNDAVSNIPSFSSLDTDQNLEIDISELEGVKDTKLGAEYILSNFDKDHSGTLNQQEYSAMQQERAIDTVAKGSMDRDTLVSKMPTEADHIIAAGTVDSSKSGTEDKKKMNSNLNSRDSVVTLDNSDAQRLEEGKNAESYDNKKINSQKNNAKKPEEMSSSVVTPAGIIITENIYTAPLNKIQDKAVEGDRGEKIGNVETILVKNDGSDAALLIKNKQGEELFTPIKDVRMENNVLVLVSGSRPTKKYDKSKYSKIDSSQKNITSAITILSVSMM